MSESKSKLKKFDLVEGPDFDLGVITSDPFKAHFFDSGLATKKAETPFDIADPESYEIEDEMVIVHVYAPSLKGPNTYRLDSLRTTKTKNSYNAYVAFDAAHDQLREILSLMEYAKKIGAIS